MRAAGLGSVCLLALICWAAFTPVEVVVSAPAAARPTSGVARLRAPDTRPVTRVLVEEGDRVAEGQLLVTLGTRMLAEQRRSALHALAVRRRDLADARAVLDIVVEGSGRTPVTPGARVQVLEHSSRLAQMNDEISSLQAELEAAARRLDTSRRVLHIKRLRHGAARAATDRGALSRFELLGIHEDLLSHQARVEELEGRVATLGERLSSRRYARRTTDAGYRRTLRRTVAGLDVEVAELTARLAELDERLRQGRVTAPIAGVVDRLTVSAGDFVQRGEPLGVVVPESAAVVFETRIAPRQAAFLYAGQPCRIKLDALPFPRYGVLGCTLESLGRDVITAGDEPAHYLARAAPSAQSLLAEGRELSLRPGATAWVDIVAGQRTVLSFVTEPLQRFARESLRER